MLLENIGFLIESFYINILFENGLLLFFVLFLYILIKVIRLKISYELCKDIFLVFGVLIFVLC